MVIGEGTNEIQRLVIARGLLARARRLGGRWPEDPPAVGQLAEHLVGVLPEPRAPGRNGGRATSEKLTGPLTERWVPARAASVDLDDPVVGEQLGVDDHLGRGLGRGPPHALLVEPLRPDVEGVLGDDLVQEGDDLGPVAADGAGVGEARVVEQLGAAEGTAHRRGCGGPPRGR